MQPILKPEEVALAPPMLGDMRYVWLNPDPENPKELDEWDKRIVDIRALRKTKPFEFMDRLRGLEKDLRQAIDREREHAAKIPVPEPIEASVPSEWKGEGACPTCKREASVNVEDLAEWKLEELIGGLLDGDDGRASGRVQGSGH